MAARPAATPRWLTDAEQQAWVAVAQLVLQLPGALDAQLQRDSGVNLFEYLTLSRLSMAPDRLLRMSALAELTGGSLSRLSNVVKRLEQRGFVRREPDPADGRFTNAILTAEGWDKVVAAAPGHVETVRHLVLDPLGPAQIAALGEIGEQLRTHVRGQCDGAAHTVGETTDC
ncbi:MAG: MarR family transcriptional regulator [Pseudonocardia sp.]|uniref:MarR family winged helix-turn-helix transcriptional regulator n=1 Tax=unclassified Pseudonocardia TaxID=2619320 RepID=UPI00086A38D5|nr:MULTISPECIES: MarR family transcriptional regulator [unclassified Pseudonocardia]MBN9108743.1 MarR family transcriptional regulator [Pseudonocardia sp.]ODU21066.1 MAG: MarR family transcriptional regulator [Pseudonocardia sp. SCN 72-51]ODV07643.1 MAG: MarR family transcriptional regulator [Pseudonocardia sp. SCN 73-27]